MANTLVVWDYVVVGFFLALSAAIGLYYRFTGGRQRTVEEYMLGNRQMSYIPVAFSLVVTIISAVSMLGMTAEYHLFGTQYVILSMGNVFSIGIQLYVFMPVFYRLKQVSVFAYFEKRYGRVTRLVASGVYIAHMMIYMGIVLYAPALALATVMDINKHVLVIGIGVVCTFYSTIGGIKAVLATDTLQALTILATFAAIIIKGAIDVGGLGEVFRLANDNGRIEFFNFNFDPTIRHTVWTQAIGGTFFYLTFAVGQNAVQRYLSVPSLSHARKSAVYAFLVGIVLTIFIMLTGLTMYANYAARKCDPFRSGQICAADQMLPFFVMELFDNMPGLPGLFLAGILSGALSTVSSSINSLAAITWADFIAPFIDTSKTPPWKVALGNKVLAAFFGLAAVGLAFLAEKFTGILQASITIFSVVGGPLIGLFTLGMLVPFSSQKSALTAFIVALSLVCWIGFGEPRPPNKVLPLFTDSCESGDGEGNWPTANSTCPARKAAKPDDEYFYLYRLSYMWLTAIGTLTTIILGTVLSFCWPQHEEVDPELLSPVLDRLLGPSRGRVKKANANAADGIDANANGGIKGYAYDPPALGSYKKKNSLVISNENELQPLPQSPPTQA